MIIISNKKTYNFEGIHIPRIYINDVKQVRESLELLQRNGSLTNKEMTEETARVRSEDIREIFYLLWKLGFGIDVSKKGREIAFVMNDKLQSIVELDDGKLKNLILERLKIYNPFIAVLDKLTDYGKQSVKFSEKDITRDFHNGRWDGGRIDNTHPLLRWSKDKDWGLVIDKKITNKGIEYINQAKALKMFYVHHTVDLHASEKLNIIAHILSDVSFNKGGGKISLNDIIGLIENIENFKLDRDELISCIKDLIKIGLPLRLINNQVLEITNKIYHDITPQYYVKFRIHLIDRINELEIKKEAETKIIEKNKILHEYSTISNLIIHEEEIDIKRYPNQSKRVNYAELFKINEILPELKIKNIILPSGWKPLKVSKINGILLAFVKSGGNLLIFHAPMGRVGSNRNLFNWLPYDLERISFVHSKGTNLRGYFTFPFGEKFMFTRKEKYKEIIKDSKKYSILFTRYGRGLIILIGFNESRSFFKKYITPLKTEIKIRPESKEWVYRYVPSLNRLPSINRESDIYPVLKEILKDNFNFKFDTKITGKAGQTDIFIKSPFFCCCEITPPNSNATGFSKVAEVEGHRKTMIFKGRKKFGKNEVGACVFGPSFTIEAGEDKAGAVDMANAMNVSLISYRDLYELICLNEKVTLTTPELKRIFFNKEEKAEAALRIYALIKIKNLL